MRIIGFLLLMIALSACSSLRQVADNLQVPERAAQAVDKYCEEIPASERAENRAAINSKTANGKIAVWCAGDPPVTLP